MANRSTQAFFLYLLLEQLLGQRLFSFFFGRMKKTYLDRVTQKRTSWPVPQPEWVDRRENLTAEEFQREYFEKGRAVIMSGAALDWPCCKKWNLDFFTFQHGEHELLLVDSQGLTTRKESKQFEFLSVRDLIDSIRQGQDKYLRFSPLLHENPQLASDLNLQWLNSMRGQNTFAHTYYMFMGGKGQKTFLHADQPCNLYVQIYGEKKWTLFYPEDSICLYPEVTNTAYVKSPVDIDRVDYARFPLFRSARPHMVHLKPGDVLYVPPHVWHQVENLTDTIAVGYRYSSLKAALKSSWTFSLIRILSTNPPVWKTRKYGKIDTNLIWAHSNKTIDQVLEKKQRVSSKN